MIDNAVHDLLKGTTMVCNSLWWEYSENIEWKVSANKF